jgi:uncharacterized membrane protein
MTFKAYLKWSILLTLGGVFFSGYMSGVRLFSGICAFNEPCPYFLGYPACYFGFAMFLAMFITSITASANKVRSLQPVKVIFAISLLGILFAGYYVVLELFSALARGTFVFYKLGLPTCAYGLVFFIIIFSISLSALRSQNEE